MFLLIGLLSGFIAGYLVHESMAARQPLRLPVGAAPAAAPGAPGGAAPAGPGGAGAGAAAAGPMSEEVARLKAHVEQNPNDADAVLALANLNFDVQMWGNARDLYQRYLELRGENPDVLTDLGVCYRELREYPRALEMFERAQRLDAKHWQSRYNAVVVLTFDLGELDRAAAAIAELRTLQPGNQDVERLAEEIERRRRAA
jgi:tetratricopeptide (TPR) repeat protein